MTPQEWVELDAAERRYTEVGEAYRASGRKPARGDSLLQELFFADTELGDLLRVHRRALINAARPKCGYCHGHGLKPQYLKGTGEMVYVAGRPCEHCQPRPPEPTGEDETEALREMLAALDTDSPTDAA